MNRVIINCDGLCEPNPDGVATAGWLAVDEGKAKTIKQSHFTVELDEGEMATNNIAEYAAVQAALGWVTHKRLFFLTYKKSVLVRTDSQVLVNQLTGKWNCHSPNLRPRMLATMQLLRFLRDEGVTVEIEWVPREQNEAADELSRQAYRDQTGHDVPDRPQWQKRKKAKV